MEASLIIAVIVVVLLTFSKRKSIFDFIRYRRMVGKLPTYPHIAYPLFGHSYLFTGSLEKVFRTTVSEMKNFCLKTQQKICSVWAGPVPLVFMLHPDSVGQILKVSHHMEKAYQYRFLHPWLGTGLLTSHGDKWKQRRHLITQSFHLSVLKGFLENMNEESQILIEKLMEHHKAGKEVDLKEAFGMYALEVICRSGMGQRVNAQTEGDSDYVRALKKILEVIQFRLKSPYLWWDYLFSKTIKGKEHDQALRILHNFTRKVVTEKMKSKGELQAISQRMAFLDVLMHAKTADGQELSLAGIQEEVDTFMFEGHETTSLALTWTTYLIGRHPDVQRRLYDEIDVVYGQDKNRFTTTDDIKKLVYMEQVINESMRIFPPSPLIGRITSEDFECDGYTIPKGTNVGIFIYHIHHSPDVWNDPETFDPERFNLKNSENRHPFAYIPFAAGPRICIGQRYAMQNMIAVLSRLLRQFIVTSHDKQEDIKINGDLLLRPATPLKVSFTVREDN